MNGAHELAKEIVDDFKLVYASIGC
jgi:hypothetical protein